MRTVEGELSAAGIAEERGMLGFGEGITLTGFGIFVSVL